MPSAKTKLTLKQLGFTSVQIQSALDNYHQYFSSYNAKEFLREFVWLTRVDEHQYAQLISDAQIPLHWRPSEEVKKTLLNEGYTEVAIAHYRDLFVIGAREQSWIARDPNRAFKAFCKRKTVKLPELLPHDWVPSKAIVEDLIAIVCSNRDYIVCQLARFIHHYHDEIHHDWDHKFKQYVHNGWNVFGHKYG